MVGETLWWLEERRSLVLLVLLVLLVVLVVLVLLEVEAGESMSKSNKSIVFLRPASLNDEVSLPFKKSNVSWWSDEEECSCLLVLLTMELLGLNDMSSSSECWSLF